MKIYTSPINVDSNFPRDHIKTIIQSMAKDADDDLDTAIGFAAFEEYHRLHEERQNLGIEQTILSLRRTKSRG